jgi:hypothetical protein
MMTRNNYMLVANKYPLLNKIKQNKRTCAVQTLPSLNFSNMENSQTWRIIKWFIQTWRTFNKRFRRDLASWITVQPLARNFYILKLKPIWTKWSTTPNRKKLLILNTEINILQEHTAMERGTIPSTLWSTHPRQAWGQWPRPLQWH